jgi:hypothetical protein
MTDEPTGDELDLTNFHVSGKMIHSSAIAAFRGKKIERQQLMASAWYRWRAELVKEMAAYAKENQNALTDWQINELQREMEHLIAVEKILFKKQTTTAD